MPSSTEPPLKHSFRRRTAPILFAAAASLLCSDARAQLLRVPQDFARIQDAIHAAAPGDTVRVDPGEYRENLYVGKRLHLLANGDPGQVIIQDPASDVGASPYSTFVLYLDDANGGEVAGFDIVGRFDINGSGIHVEQGGWRIAHCRIRSNEKGIVALSAPVTLLNNVVEMQDRVGIVVGTGSTVIGNVVRNNNQGINIVGRALVANNVVTNSFFGIQIQSDSARVVNNVIATVGASNEGSQQIGVRLNVSGRGVFANNIVAYGGRIGIFADPGESDDVFVIRSNDVFGHPLDYQLQLFPWNLTGYAGNVSLPPLFADNPGAFYLASNSLLIDAGSSDLLDPDGSRSDIGAYGGPYSSPVRYAPSTVQLASPAHRATVPSPAVLSWDPSFDLDPDDQVTYRVRIARETDFCYIHALVYRSCLGGDVDTLYTDQTSISVPLADTSAYYWTVDAVDTSGLYTGAGEVRAVSPAPVVSTEPGPRSPVRLESFPNPARHAATISVTLTEPASMRVSVLDALGREVVLLTDGEWPIGAHALPLSVRGLAPGVYLVRLETEPTSRAPTVLTQRLTISR